MIIIDVIFWLCVVLLGYTYFGYPMLLRVLVRLRNPRPLLKKNIEPMVSMVIPAYNEEESIGAKLDNVLALDYPKDKLDIVVASDSSSDRSDEIVKRYADRGVRLIRVEPRGGKINAYRRVYPELKGDVIVYSDATSVLEKNSLRQLLSNFSDPSVGCAGGMLRYENVSGATAGKGEDTYWKYEKPILLDESSLASLTSVSGTFYAVYKKLFPCTMAADLADDLIVPLNVVRNGFRAVLDTAAVCHEHTIHASSAELNKRARITVQNIRGIVTNMDMLNIFKYGLFSLMVISHKLFRVMVPLFLAGTFISNCLLISDSLFYRSILIAQLLFYGVGLIGHMLDRAGKIKVVNSIFFFCLSNLAILAGIVRFFKGMRVVTWEPARANDKWQMSNK